MAKNVGHCYYKILREFIQACNFEKLQPVFTTIVKRYGASAPTLGKKLIHHLCVENSIDVAVALMNELNKNNLKVNFPVDVLRMLTEQGRSLYAYRLVLGAQNDLSTMDVVDYSIIIDGLCKEGFIDEAIKLCNFAIKRGVTLSVVTYNSLFNGLCLQGCLIEAFRLFDSLERNNIIPSDITYGTLIDALVREGFLSDARQLFERMILKGIEPNIHMYNSLIYGYCKFGNLEEALQLLYDLENRSLHPDKFTVSVVLYGFSLKGDLEQALQFFFDMRRNNFFPDFLGFLSIVRGLCAKGRMEEARSILREMLQDESVVELISRFDNEVENESIVSFLVHLCDQGSIQGALAILNEIGLLFFPDKRNFNSTMQEQTLSREGDLQVTDFDVLYSKVASLCSEGDLEGANALAKGMISNFVGNQ